MAKLPTVLILLFPTLTWPAPMAIEINPGFEWIGFASLLIFFAAILLVSFEEFIELRKSKPMLLSAGLIWALNGLSAVLRFLLEKDT